MPVYRPLKAIAAACIFGSVAAFPEDRTPIPMAVFIERVASLEPGDSLRESLIDERRMICETSAGVDWNVQHVCTGAVVVDFGGAGVLPGRVTLAFERGTTSFAIFKFEKLARTPLHATFVKFGKPFGEPEHRRVWTEEADEPLERRLEARLLPNGHLIMWISDSNGDEGLAVAFDTHFVLTPPRSGSTGNAGSVCRPA